MSIKYMTRVWESGSWEGSTLVLMLALADHANDEGQCWPTIPTLAKKCRLSERQCQRVIHSLIEEGAIKVVETGNGRGHRTLYELSIKGDTHDTLPQEERVTSRVKRVTSRATKGDIAVSPPSEPSLEPPIEPPIEKLAEPTAPPRSPSEHQQMFEKVCEIVGWDYHVLDAKSSGQLAQTLGILKEHGYTLEHLNRFGKEVWADDWRWVKNRQRPTLTQLRQEIGKLNASPFSEPPTHRQTTRYAKNGFGLTAWRKDANDNGGAAASATTNDNDPEWDAQWDAWFAAHPEGQDTGLLMSNLQGSGLALRR